MKVIERRELYVSQNGDRWDVVRNGEGKLQVVHRANEASGGKVSVMDIGTFLSSHHNKGPEHQALIHLLRTGSLNADVPLELGA